WAWQLTEAGRSGAGGLRRGSRTRRLADLLDPGALDEDRLALELDGWREAARALLKRGLVERLAVAADTMAPAPQPGPQPNAEQLEAISVLAAATGFSPVRSEERRVGKVGATRLYPL